MGAFNLILFSIIATAASPTVPMNPRVDLNVKAIEQTKIGCASVYRAVVQNNKKDQNNLRQFAKINFSIVDDSIGELKKLAIDCERSPKGKSGCDDSVNAARESLLKIKRDGSLADAVSTYAIFIRRKIVAPAMDLWTKECDRDEVRNSETCKQKIFGIGHFDDLLSSLELRAALAKTARGSNDVDQLKSRVRVYEKI